MKPGTLALGLSLWLLSAAASAAPAAAGPPACAPPPHCTPAATGHRLSFPAQALSFGTPDSAFTAHARGMRWENTDGVATLTIRRPLDYDGGEVTLSLFHEVLDDSAGDIAFIVTPVSFNNGSGFETYGDALTDLVAAPESLTILVEQSATLQSGDGGYQWPPTGEWWYFEFRRSGSFEGPLRLMAVAIDY